ncbi:MAG TPA: right-handed parallel beta-helix repeat-containing protein [Chryseolinea sp.]|nr:right-handed parallel beta-helix repeat-containing protein [Chryseolinea sp.]
MKLILVIICTFNFSWASAKTYFLSSSMGSDSRSVYQAQYPITPWKTLNRLNSFKELQPGDSVLFKRGDVFYGTLQINRSGTRDGVITYSAYGKGANPVISGLTSVGEWVVHNENIFYTTLTTKSLNIVTVDGVTTGIGRYPNDRYLSYELHKGNESITDHHLDALPSWVGGEVVIRKYRWIIDRHTITDHLRKTLSYNSLSTYGNNKAYEPVNGNGYFIQNHINTLDKFGEWFYDALNNRLYIHFGGKDPTNFVVEVSTQDYNTKANTASYISFKNVDFNGGNVAGISLINCHDITISNCNFSRQGGISIYGGALNNVVIQDGSVEGSGSNGIYFEYDSDDCSVEKMKIENTNLISGSGRSGDGVGIGISVTGNRTRITNNIVKNSGYNGIQFTGDSVTVENNFIENFCLTKDDGGGIYTYAGDQSIVYANRVIRNNLVINAVGRFEGVESYYYEPYGKAAGIYLDDFSNHTIVANNTVVNGQWAGIFLHNASDNVIKNNAVFSCATQLLMEQSAPVIRNTSVIENSFYAKTVQQQLIYYKTYADDDPRLVGAFNYNYYAKPSTDDAVVVIDKDYNGGREKISLKLPGWQTSYHQDSASYESDKQNILLGAYPFK